MSLRLQTPVVLRIAGHPREALEPLLTYRDKSVDFELQRLRNSVYLRDKLGPQGYAERVEELKAQRKPCLLFEDAEGLWTYSGFAAMLEQKLGEPKALREFPLPAPRPLALHGPLAARDPRPYQLEGNQALLGAVHGAVEEGTGLGKSFQALLLVAHHGLKTVVMAPSKNIAEQLHEDFVSAFGKGKVGLFGDGKHEYGKLITVAIAASLTRLEPGSPAWEVLSTAQVFIADESHLTPAKTLQKVCFGLLAGAPYRYFFSGTQLRGDGADLLLQGITGKVVFGMSVRQGVDQGWLARPFFRMVQVGSDKKYYNRDAERMTRVHLYYNQDVIRAAAALANKSVSFLGHQVLILVQELEQFQVLLPWLKHSVRFAHGPVAKADLKYVPEAYQKCDVKALVKAFNAREFPILVGTSCISTGTDIQSAEHVIWLRGGKSEVELRQGVGRGTRKVDAKRFFNFSDFCVRVAALQEPTCVEKHAFARAEILQGIYPNSFKEVPRGSC